MGYEVVVCYYADKCNYPSGPLPPRTFVMDPALKFGLAELCNSGNSTTDIEHAKTKVSSYSDYVMEEANTYTVTQSAVTLAISQLRGTYSL